MAFVLLGVIGCRAESRGSDAGTPLRPGAVRAAARADIEIPPSLRGLAVGPPDPNGIPSVVPCATCHDGADASVPMPTAARGLAGPHRGLRVEHGGQRCAACHHPTRRDALRLADGRAVALTEAMRLCAQCHGPQARAYQHGAHGGMRGSWDTSQGSRSRNHCVSCHDPHAPAFGSFVPMPGPRDRFLSRQDGGVHD